MSITAVVRNNTVQLPPGVNLPDGTQVLVAFEVAPVSGSAQADALARLPDLAEPMGVIGNSEMDAAVYGR